VGEREKILLADIEDQLSATYKADEEIWAEIARGAAKAVAEADRQIAEICRSWGVPENFRPSLSLSWYNRGENAAAGRRAELRKPAQVRLAAAGQTARVAIDDRLLDIETELIREGLSSDQAHAFLNSLPTAEALMPSVHVAELEGADPEGDPRIRRWE